MERLSDTDLYADGPFDIATFMWYTGIDPMSGKAVQVARHLRDCKLQRDLMQFFKPENWFDICEVLLQANRQALIDSGCDALIPPSPPAEEIEGNRKRANTAERNDHTHSVFNPA